MSDLTDAEVEHHPHYDALSEPAKNMTKILAEALDHYARTGQDAPLRALAGGLQIAQNALADGSNAEQVLEQIRKATER
jgi:hypothetical protein